MSEHLPRNHEKLEREKSPESTGEDIAAERLKELHEQAEQAGEKQKAELGEIFELEKQAEQEAVSGKDELIGEIGKEDAKENAPTIDKSVKKAAYKKELSRIQQQLPAPQRILSKVIHNEAVEKVSNISGKTVARPSGLLGGSLISLLGGVIIIWMSRYYGFRYNFFVFIALLILGFLLGLIAETFVRNYIKIRQR